MSIGDICFNNYTSWEYTSTFPTGCHCLIKCRQKKKYPGKILKICSWKKPLIQIKTQVPLETHEACFIKMPGVQLLWV